MDACGPLWRVFLPDDKQRHTHTQRNAQQKKRERVWMIVQSLFLKAEEGSDSLSD